jgi:hypothetical protein
MGHPRLIRCLFNFSHRTKPKKGEKLRDKTGWASVHLNGHRLIFFVGHLHQRLVQPAKIAVCVASKKVEEWLEFNSRALGAFARSGW